MKLFLLTIMTAFCFVSAIAQETESEIDKLPKGETFKKLLEEVDKNKEPLSGQFKLRDCDECSCPGAHASRWDVIYGKAVSIVDSDTIVVEAFKVSDDDTITESNKKLFTIDLIGIDTNGNEPEVIMYLQKNILNHRVNIFVKWKTGNNLQSSGEVQKISKDSGVIINRYFLEKGIVKYKKIADDALDDERVTDCEYKVLERKAKEAKLGIWAK